MSWRNKARKEVLQAAEARGVSLTNRQIKTRIAGRMIWRGASAVAEVAVPMVKLPVGIIGAAVKIGLGALRK